ncbi:MAG TPA: SGNH family hydrolase [Pseudolabrys sp.]|nr:SGNH family hydrolase [Pseudolabrys sp.]
MVWKIRFSHWLVGAVILAVAECASVAAIDLALTQPAQAQRADDRYPFLSRQRQQGGFFGGFFGGGYNPRPYPGEYPPQQPQYQSESSHAPAAHKPDPNAPAPTTSIVVMGDGMADWLAYGLEDAFSDSPEVAIVRKNKVHSGLLRYEAKGDLDWWHVARDLLAQEKPNYVVMMLGVSDRQNIRERDLEKEADKDVKDEQDKKNADQNAQTKDQADDQDQGRIIAPEPQRGRSANGIIEFRSDKWAEVYSKRIDDTIAALKSKGVPVFWVGLPAIRGTKSTADASYLNDLYRARAERAGVNYIDVWDGFVDEAGKYSNFGPDYEGQMRRLRSGDGVYFTKSGARKLAHYVEREIRRYMSNRVPVAFPALPVGPVPETKSKVRPVAGPVVPLTVTPGNSEELLGGGGSQPVHADVTADRVLVKGEPVPAPPGRADDFVWPPGSDAKAVAPAANAAAPPVAAAVAEPKAVARTEPIAVVKPPEAPKSGGGPKILQTTGVKPRHVEQRVETKRAPQGGVPRPPADIPQSRLNGWFR